MFLPNTPLLLLATVVRGVNTLLGRADAVMATARGALPRKSITSSVPVLIPCCFAMSRKPDFQPAAQRQLGGLRTILRSLHPLKRAQAVTYRELSTSTSSDMGQLPAIMLSDASVCGMLRDSNRGPRFELCSSH